MTSRLNVYNVYDVSVKRLQCNSRLFMTSRLNVYNVIVGCL